MIKKVFKEEKEIGNYVSDIIEKDIKERNNSGKTYYLGLATGSTPIPVYKELIRRYEKDDIDFFNVITYNLDEYVSLDESHPESYHSFMNENLFDHINIKKENINILNGNANDLNLECENFDKKIFETGIDLQILGIGENGHIAFNEPSENLKLKTHIEELTEDTIKVNSRFFDSVEEVPRKALTMGMKSIFKADKIILIATGEKKAEAISYLLKNENITNNNPSSLLLLHDNLTLVLDEACYNKALKILEGKNV